jgi:Protein of unknown function (DUF3303)
LPISKEIKMKLVLVYSDRAGGNVTENLEAAESAQKLLSKWAPNPSATIHQWLQRCDGNGGFAVVETDDVAALYKDIAIWSSWLEFEVYPVLDIDDSTPLLVDALATARSVV